MLSEVRESDDSAMKSWQFACERATSRFRTLAKPTFAPYLTLTTLKPMLEPAHLIVQMAILKRKPQILPIVSPLPFNKQGESVMVLRKINASSFEDQLGLIPRIEPT